MLFHGLLILATFLCSLVGGFLFAFATVVMPGIRILDDGGFIRTFQVIDGVIQRNQPLFVFVWVGSVVSLIAAAVLGASVLAGADRLLLIAAAFVYVLCVQLPTVIVNIPLNNRLQKLETSTMSESMRGSARENFEPRWNRWNVFRSACASLVTIVLVFLLFRL